MKRLSPGFSLSFFPVNAILLKRWLKAIAVIVLLLIFSGNAEAQTIDKKKLKSIEAQKAKQFAKEEKERERERKNGKYENEEEEDRDGYDGPGEALEFEIERTKDPATGKVPWERLRSAIIQTDQAKQNTPNRTNALSWIERGPDGDFTGGGNPRPTGQQTAGRIRAIIVDSLDATHKTVLVGSVSGGLWRTTDITAAFPTWTLVNDFLSNLAIASICQDPRPGFQNIMYLCTGESYGNADAVRGVGAFKSIDGGATWTFLSSTSGFLNGTRILCDFQGNVYLGTRGAGLQRSTDGGTTWTNITPTGIGSDICDLKISTTGAAGRLHVTTGIFSTSGYRYTDIPATVTSGTWTSATTPFTTFGQRTEMGISGNVLYACPSNGSYQVPTIWVSTDGGANWASVATQPSTTWANGQAWYDISVGINPSDPTQCIVGGLDLWKTTNGGTSWTKISSWATSVTGFYVHADQHNIQWWDGGTKLLFGCDGGLHFSSDGGTTNDHRNKGLRMKQFYSVAIHPNETNYFIAGAQDNGMHRLNHPGLDSSLEVVGGDGAYCAIDQNEPQFQFGSYVYNVYRRSVNNGASWSTPINNQASGRFINPWDYDNTGNIIYACNNTGTYLRWNNPQTGSSSDVVTASGFTGNVSAVHVSPYTANKVYFGMGSGGIQYVDNANTGTSVTATNITPAGASGYVSCVVTGSSDQNLLATYSSYGVNQVWVSTNGGTSWTSIDGNLPDMPVRWALFHPDDNTKAFIATETGVWETTLINGASTVWTANSSFPNVRTDMIKYRASDRTIAAGTHGRGIWSATIPLAGPDVTINQAAAQADPTSTSPINFTVVFSEAVTGFATGDVTLSGTAGATTGVVTGSGTTYNVAVSGMTSSGTVIATIAAGVCINGASEPNNASTSTDNTVTFNLPAVPPTVTINQAAAQADPTSTSPINFTVVFSEPVTGFTTGDVTLSGTAGATTGTVTGSGATYNVAVSGMTSSGTVIATIAAGVATGTVNVTGNAASTSTDNTVTYNMPVVVPPTVTINQAAAQADPTSTSPINFTVVFSEPVTGFTTGDVTLSGTAGATTGTVTGSGATYNVAVSGMTSSGTVIATIAAGVATGTVNVTGNAASTSTDNTVTYNMPVPVPPTVTINQAAAQADPTSTSPINFTVVFSEPVTGFTTGDVTVTGTAGATTGIVTGSGATYNVAVSGMSSSGTVIATIAAGVATGTVNVIGNAASTSTDNTVQFNLGACSILLTSGAGTDNQTVCNNSPITTITYATTGAAGATFSGLPAGVTGSWAADVVTISGSPSAPGTFNYTVTLTGGSCTTENAMGTITVNPIPDVNQPANQVVCSGAMTAPVNFTGSVPGTIFNWTNSNPGIGLAASGSGNIPAFTAVNAGNAPIVATINVTPQTGGPSPVTFSNPASILIPGTGTSGAAAPYPSAITVTGLPTTGVTVGSVTLNNITHTFAGDIEILLVAPNGQKFVLMSDVGSAAGLDATATLTLRDGFPLMPTTSTPIPTGTYAPTSANSTSVWPAPAPAAPYNFPAPAGSSTFAGVFNNSTNYNGTWNLYINDDAGGDVGDIANGWSITLLVPSSSTCIGSSKSFTYTVNPIPNATATPANQNICSNGSNITPIVLAGNVAGTVFNWTRNNTATVTGIAASGSGNITGALTNTTNAPVTVTFTITPTANGCAGTPVTATVTVAPTIAVNPVPNQTVCNGSMTAPVNFSGPTPGTMYSWTNNTPSIGLPASGSGNIPAFTATNATTLPVTATITVTPKLTLPGAIAFTGSLDAGDATLTAGRLNRNGVASTCAAPKAYPGPFGTGPYFYDLYTLVNTTGADQCVTVNYSSTTTNQVHVTAYNGSFDPNNLGTNYIADGGSSATGPTPVTFSFTAPAGATIVFHVFEPQIGQVCPEYNITIDGLPTTCSGPSSSFNITVNPTPTITCPAPITAASTVGACNVAVNYAATVTGTPAPVLTYSFSGATTGSGSGSGSGSLFNVGVTTVTLTATNICATVTCSFTVTVTDSQLPTITTQPVNRTVCAGSSATFSVSAVTAPSAGGPLSYQWQSWNGSTWNDIPGATSASYTVNNTTVSMNTNTFRVRVTGLCSTVFSAARSLYVNALPAINLTTSIPPNLLPTQVLTITATGIPGGGSYVWQKNGVTIPGAGGNTLSGLTVSDIGTYRVIYTDPNGCTSTSSSISITGQPSDNIYVYPVPNDGRFIVRFYNQANEQVTLRVIDAKGAEVYRQNVQTTIPYTTINVNLTTNRIFANGVYVVEVRKADGSLAGTKRIIIYR